MPRVTFNQEVKHGVNVYGEGDSVTVTQEEADYFGANGWLEGVDATATRDNPVTLDIPPSRSVDIVPENPYDTLLEVQSSTHATSDTGES